MTSIRTQGSYRGLQSHRLENGLPETADRRKIAKPEQSRIRDRGEVFSDASGRFADRSLSRESSKARAHEALRAWLKILTSSVVLDLPLIGRDE